MIMKVRKLFVVVYLLYKYKFHACVVNQHGAWSSSLRSRFQIRTWGFVVDERVVHEQAHQTKYQNKNNNFS